MYGLVMVRPVRLSLTLRLILAHVAVGLLAILVAVLVYRWSSGPAFGDMLLDQAREHFHSDVVYYYREHGFLDGIAGGVPSGQTHRGPPKVQPPGSSPVPFSVADASGVIVYAGPGYEMGQQAPVEALRRGEPVVVDGALAGTILVPPNALPPIQALQAYAVQIDTAERWAALLGALVAAVAGVLLARGITNPIKRLTAAMADVSAGRTGHQVAVIGQNELAQLAAAFNGISAELARQEQARLQLAADIAHDLRTPLTTIGGYVEAMRDGDLAPTAERLDSVCRQARRLDHVIADLRLLVQADVGTLPLDLEEVRLPDVLADSVQAHAIRAGRRGIDLRSAFDPATPVVLADPHRVQQVVEILLSNALRHTDSGFVEVSCSADGDGAVIKVADTGSGIPSEALPRLFDRFYRGAQARQRDAEGSGLGLAIAHAIVAAHGGSIAVASRPGEGATFLIRLPARVMEAAA
jgi:signal transduction histidine kinase